MKTGRATKYPRYLIIVCSYIIFIVFLMITAPASPVSAALGSSERSVHADREYMKGVISRVQATAYTVHEIRTASGTKVREYVTAGGTVFAVAWSGPFIPDLQQLLGAYFQQYASAARAARAQRPGRRPLNIQQPGLVVQTFGQMRSYYGRAYIPGLVPAGVSADIIE
jgi:hypothetical protein